MRPLLRRSVLRSGTVPSLRGSGARFLPAPARPGDDRGGGRTQASPITVGFTDSGATIKATSGSVEVPPSAAALRMGSGVSDGASSRESGRAYRNQDASLPGGLVAGGRREPTGVQQERSVKVAITTPIPKGLARKLASSQLPCKARRATARARDRLHYRPRPRGR